VIYVPPKRLTNACVYETESDGNKILIYRIIPLEEYNKYYQTDRQIESRNGYIRLYLRSVDNAQSVAEFIHSCWHISAASDIKPFTG
jgi:hypothetical protein